MGVRPLATLALAVIGCSTSLVDVTDGSVDLAVGECADYVVVGPHRAWLGAPRDVLPIVCGGTESLYLMHGGAFVPVTGGETSAGSITLDAATGAAVLHAPCTPWVPTIDVRLGTPHGCGVAHVTPGWRASYIPYGDPHSCGTPPGCLGCDYGYGVQTLSGGHAHVCFATGAGGSPWGEIVDETYDPCAGNPSCTRLRFDLMVIDTPVGSGLDHVPSIDGPAAVSVAVGETVVECFIAPLPFDTPRRVIMSILDDGWTYDAPPLVALASVDSGVTPVPDCVSVTGVTPGAGTLTVRLLDATRDVAVAVR